MLNRIFDRAFRSLQVRCFPTVQDRELARWRRDLGDKEKRFDYPLNSDSAVIDLGGFDGQWASDVFARHLSNIHVFEAVPAYAGDIASRFKGNPKIRVYPFAVGREDRVDFMDIAGVGSSMFRDTGHAKTTPVNVLDANTIFHLCGVTRCDLLKINIEGGEYEVLPRFIETGFISKIESIQVQFHDLGEASRTMAKSIQSDLSKTHVRTWSYEWVWENWVLKDSLRPHVST